MEKKKSRKANLEKSKKMFLSIGLIIAIGLVVSAFSWKSTKVLTVFETNGDDIPEEVQMKQTETKPDPPKKKNEPKQKQIKKQILDIINMTTDTSTIEPFELIWNDSIEFDPVEETGPDILDYSSIKPKFPGGKKALMLFVGNNVNYPALARENNIQGTVYIRFEVTKTGKIGKVELQKGVDPIIDDEAIAVIKKLPKFKPGMHNGVNVNVWYSIPISFVLNN